MLARTKVHKLTAGLVLVALAAVTFAPVAEARSHGRKYKRVQVAPNCVERVVYRPSSRVVVHQSSAGPVIAGLIGGFLLGTAVSNANASVHYAEYAPAPVGPDYYYYDPICQVRYSSFDQCRSHVGYHGGPRVVQVIEVNSGQCVETYQWVGGSWHYHAGNYWND